MEFDHMKTFKNHPWYIYVLGKKKCSKNPEAYLKLLSDLLGYENQDVSNRPFYIYKTYFLQSIWITIIFFTKKGYWISINRYMDRERSAMSWGYIRYHSI